MWSMHGGCAACQTKCWLLIEGHAPHRPVLATVHHAAIAHARRNDATFIGTSATTTTLDEVRETDAKLSTEQTVDNRVDTAVRRT